MTDKVSGKSLDLQNYQKHPLIGGVKTRIKLLKTLFANAGVPVMSEEIFQQRLSVKEVQEVTQLLVQHHLHLTAGPRKAGRLQFIKEAGEGMYKKTMEVPKELLAGTQTKGIFPEEMSQLEARVHEWLSFYHRVFQGITGLHPLPQGMVLKPHTPLEFVYDTSDTTKTVDSVIPATLLKSIIRLSVLRSLGKTGLGKVPENDTEIEFTISELERKILLAQTLPPESGFHTLSAEKKHIIVTSENFGVGFDGNDLEALGYQNIATKLDEDALRCLVSILKPEDTSCRNICPRISTYLSRNSEVKFVTRQMIEAEYGDTYVAQIERRDEVHA